MLTIDTLPAFNCSLYFSAMRLLAVFIMLALKAPAKPRFDDTVIINTLFGIRSSKNGDEPSSKLADKLANNSFSLLAYGRNCTIALVARFNLAAETIFMALVICCVELTELIRFLTSFKLAILFLSIKYQVHSIKTLYQY